MIVEITGVTISADEITLEGTNLETMLTADDLYAELDEEKVRFVFDRHEYGGAALKYLYKVCQSQRKCQTARSLGEKLDKLVGCIISLSENFKEQ
ncbi:hypothetical protein SAMN06296386_11520 [Lachnospiraceae bacterium]|nr:hypothetical protein SAMN06296386_11520 [Lachnospiraceae bacterium]